MKFLKWFTVWCWKHWCFNALYAFQQSKTIVIPSSTYMSTTANRVSVGSILNRDNEGQTRPTLYTTKNLWSFDESTSVIFAFSSFGFIYLNHFPWPSYGLGFQIQFDKTYLTTKGRPVDNCCWRKVHSWPDVILFWTWSLALDPWTLLKSIFNIKNVQNCVSTPFNWFTIMFAIIV